MAYQFWGPKVPKRNGSQTQQDDKVKQLGLRPIAPHAINRDAESDPQITPLIKFYGQAEEKAVSEVPLDTWNRLRSRIE